MEFYDFNQLYVSKQFAQRKAVISIGVFDGLHKGHQEIIRTASNKAKEIGNCDLVVFTFAQNPKMMMGRAPFLPPLFTIRLTSVLYQSLGVDKVVVIDFSPNFSKLTGEEFIARLTSLFDVRAIVVGENFRCGLNADTTPKEISHFLPRYTKNALLIVPHMYRLKDGTNDSSTLVRTKIIEGKLAESAALLGRNYSLDLAHIPSRKDGCPPIVSLGSFVQLLPPPGEYDALLFWYDSTSFKVMCCIDEKFLTITCRDELKRFELSLTKREPTRYDRLEFIKELP
ncbi:MAG: FAD synthetase family protein [Spirochaetia bacterium]|nr:FAD synthetase family protein [Spirochaetia bacterium]